MNKLDHAMLAKLTVNETTIEKTDVPSLLFFKFVEEFVLDSTNIDMSFDNNFDESTNWVKVK